MITIRVSGPRDEVTSALRDIRQTLSVRGASKPRPCDTPGHVRVYVTAALPTDKQGPPAAGNSGRPRSSPTKEKTRES